MKIHHPLFVFLLLGLLLLSVAAGTAGQGSSSNAASQNYLPILLKPQPELPAAAVRWSDKPAFDRCNPPSLSQMQTWWDQSPYWSVGIYLGGVSYPSGCDNSALTAAWVAEANRQGWSFIPIWVGPQSYCYYNKPIAPERLHKVMSLEIGAAYQQGIGEANLAFAAAARLGLTGKIGSPGLIYYDLEAYNYPGEPIAECRAAAQAFMYGWTVRLHELGSKAGAYGSGCSTYVYDWNALPVALDNVWLASWYKIDGQYQYDPNATVWNALCVSNDLWANRQRLRQYAGGHDETWGAFA
ncbi:MAG: glycoside hydrolase domain-containing protein [Chloroflexota bacterium]